VAGPAVLLWRLIKGINIKRLTQCLALKKLSKTSSYYSLKGQRVRLNSCLLNVLATGESLLFKPLPVNFSPLTGNATFPDCKMNTNHYRDFGK
jgi:hypothetical protein